MKLYMDDVRPCPDGWRVARTIDDAKLLLSTGTVIYASLDHDMGACDDCIAKGAHVGDMATPETTFLNWCPHVPDGTALVRWMVETGTWPEFKPTVHSANPLGRARMQGLIHSFFGCQPLGPMFPAKE